MKRSFVYSADTPFDTASTYQSLDIIGGWDGSDFRAGFLRMLATGSNPWRALTIWGAGSGSRMKWNLLATNSTRWLQSVTRVWTGNVLT
jgi:hypothetical protein